MSNKGTNRTNGQTLVELIVVVAVGALIVGVLTFATISTIRNAQFAKNQTQATKLAQEGIERLRSARDRNKSLIIAGTSVNYWSDIWNFSLSDNCGIYSYNCYFKFITDGTITGCSNASDGCISYLGTYNKIPSSSESISATSPDTAAKFTRAAILTDSASTYSLEKIVTVMVSWGDFSGTHESRISTVLRRP